MYKYKNKSIQTDLPRLPTLSGIRRRSCTWSAALA